MSMFMPFYFYEDDLIGGIVSLILAWIPTTAFSILSYVLTGVALYTIAKRRGLNRPWLSWVPVVNCWILGSVSDQYQYVVRGENRSKRKSLLVLNLLSAALGAAAVVMLVVFLTQLAVSAWYPGYSDADLVRTVMGSGIGLLGLSLPMLGVALAFAIIRYMALYDVYRSMDPGNAVLFLVLSILFRPTIPFFLFFNRNKDGGMPPRRQPDPVYQTSQPDPAYQTSRQEPWQQPENKDYL